MEAEDKDEYVLRTFSQVVRERSSNDMLSKLKTHKGKWLGTITNNQGNNKDKSNQKAR